MKISIVKIGNDMAELHEMAMTLNDAAAKSVEDEDEDSLYKASDEVLARIDNLKELTTFQRPDCIGDVLILALLAANHLKYLQPGRLPQHMKREAATDQYIAAGKTIPISRLLDAIITGIEKHAKLTREDLGLAFLREREADKQVIFEKALDTLMEPEAKDQKAKKAA